MKRSLPLLILLACAGVLLFGIYELFRLRYESGDVYPPYSTLRSDPLGTMILYESLSELPHRTVRRDFSADNTLPPGRQTTYLHLAASPADWEQLSEEVFREAERFLTTGGRLVVAFYPRVRSAGPATTNVTATVGPPKKKPTKGLSAKADPGTVALKDRWQVEFGLRPLASGQGVHIAAMARNQTDLDLPEELAWHSSTVFTNLAPAWRVIYAREAGPVLVERAFGAGSVVLTSDCFFLSNESMMNDRQAGLLSWLLGPARAIVFDEAHLGIVESAGVITLMRQYRLHYLALALALLAGLFIWRNAFSFVPHCPDEAAPSEVAGKEAVAGLVNLLRRNFAPADLLNVCFAEWTKSLVRARPHLLARVDQAQALVEAEHARAQTSRNPVRAYRDICSALKKASPETPPQKL
jgi:hypothetical protein